LRLVGLLGAIAAFGWLGWLVWRGPDPAEILASIDFPPAPRLSPEAERARFRTPPGFRVELVAAEPLVVDPVAIDWDDQGRLYVVEMRGYMPNLDARGEDDALGRVVVLEDDNQDGRMDRSRVLLDGLVLPRAVAVLPGGLLIGAPPDLLLCPAADGEPSCEAPIRLGHYGSPDANPEHSENGLLAALDGWIYNAKSDRRFRLDGATLEVEPTAFRGQWGIDQDDAGRLFYNHNSAFLLGDRVPGEYTVRQPWLAANAAAAGVGGLLSEGEQVFGVRVAPGLNRAYMSGTLRRDGRQDAPTAVSGLAIQRGDQFGPGWVGSAFIPEAAGSAVAHFTIERDGSQTRAEHQLYDDPDWGQREFLTSTDERFRPVDAEIGPDGALWVVDMYRGVIQHSFYLSEYLRNYATRQGLEPPGATGRIWRVVREERPLPRRPPPLSTLAEQLAAIDHPNGWVRDRAQRRLVHERDPGAVRQLRQLDDFGPLGRRHALWALAHMGELDAPTWQRALADPDPTQRELALRAGEERAATGGPETAATIAALLDDPEETVRIQALHSLGALPAAVRPLDELLERARRGDTATRYAVLSSLSGLESLALERELERTRAAQASDDEQEWLRDLAAARFLAAREGPSPREDLIAFLDLVDTMEVEWQRRLALEAIVLAQRTAGSRRIELHDAHRLFDPQRDEDPETTLAVARARRHFTWPGDPTPGGARALTAEQQERRARGQQLFAASCANCHGEDGSGLTGLAPALVGSPWLRDADDWLVRIALDGLTGPLSSGGEAWDHTMPGHRADPRFDDSTLAGLLTHLRRSWGHAEAPVAPETVARVRAETAERGRPWTTDELLSLPVEHRFDRYVGVYAIPVVNIELEIRRSGTELMLGQPGGPSTELEEVGDGLFVGPELSIQFEVGDSGEVESASGLRDGTRIPLSKRS